jgi:preprotein translocase subunit SecB
MNDINNAKSILKMDNLYFDSVIFKNTGSKSVCDSELDAKIKFAVQTFSVNDTGFSVRLKLSLLSQEYYSIDFSLVGVFSVEGGFGEENAYLRDNAIAIMFPYIRSQVTLLTAQPGMKPIVLPPLNIKTLMSDYEEPAAET